MHTERLTNHPLVRFLRAPTTTVPGLTVEDWSVLLGAARRGSLLSHVACRIERLGLMGDVPDSMRLHLSSALRRADTARTSTLREVRDIRRALGGAQIPLLLLKGAAYIVAGHEAGHGRLMSDVDIMVPRVRLMDAERSLLEHGWMSSKLDAYDQRYYRDWMHELPPMHHLERGSSLDVHHTILPPTGGIHPDVDALWAGARHNGLPDGVGVLCPEDMVLHSAAHLFHEGEFENGLRDLVDLDGLLREFGADAAFWDRLQTRAALHQIEWPLYYALRYCRRLFDTPVPAGIVEESQRRNAAFRYRGLMDRLMIRCLASVTETRPGLSVKLALFGLYVRSHYLRMPLRQLIPHLWRKQFSNSGH